jgi:hypothetical protein
MSISVFGPAATVSILNRAFNDISPANALFKNQVAQATTKGDFAFAIEFGKGFDSMSNAALSNMVLGNLGLLPNAALETAVTDYFAANSASRGLVVLQLGTILSGLEGAQGELAIYASAAVAWNAEVTTAFTYSDNTANVIDSPKGDNASLASDAAKAASATAHAASVAANATAATAAADLATANAALDTANTAAAATDAAALTAASVAADAAKVTADTALATATTDKATKDAAVVTAQAAFDNNTDPAQYGRTRHCCEHCQECCYRCGNCFDDSDHGSRRRCHDSNYRRRRRYRCYC